MSAFSYFEEKIRNTIKEHSIDRLVIGYSGGSDSQFLLHCAKNISIDKVAVHINHGISENANHWELFCQKEATAHNFSFKSFQLNFKSIQNNVEEKARIERYKIFKEQVKGKTLLLTGHHMDDQAETVLMRIFRGTGLDGLEGIQEYSEQDNLSILRPLLDIDKDAIKETLINQGIEWIEDESNQESDYDRNFIRNNILPMIKERWGAAQKNISKLSQICQKENKDIKKRSNELLKEVLVDDKLCLETLKKFPENDIEKIIRAYIKDNGAMTPSQKQMNSILKQIVYSNKNGKVMFKNFSIQKYNNYLYFVSNHHNLVSFYKNFDFDVFYLADFDKSASVLHNGMHKKVHKIFQEKKVEPWKRNVIPIAVYKGEIIGIGNMLKGDNSPFCSELFDFS